MCGRETSLAAAEALAAELAAHACASRLAADVAAFLLPPLHSWARPLRMQSAAEGRLAAWPPDIQARAGAGRSGHPLGGVGQAGLASEGCAGLRLGHSDATTGAAVMSAALRRRGGGEDAGGREWDSAGGGWGESTGGGVCDTEADPHPPHVTSEVSELEGYQPVLLAGVQRLSKVGAPHRAFRRSRLRGCQECVIATRESSPRALHAPCVPCQVAEIHTCSVTACACCKASASAHATQAQALATALCARWCQPQENQHAEAAA